MKKLIITALALLLPASISFASEMDRLVEKLVEKGILTQGEAYRIVAEAKEETRKQEAMVKQELDRVPGWIKNTRFSGDIRLRYEMHGRERHDGASITDRHRTRVRFRWGFETKVNDQLSAGLRIATGQGNQQSSANQTFTRTFTDKEIWLDRAYARYSPTDNISFTGGKMGNPFYRTSLVWSGDVNPEGFVMQAKIPAGSEFFATAGYFPLLEVNNPAANLKDDPYMLGGQLGYAGKAGDIPFRAAATYYLYEGVKGYTPAALTDQNAGGNTVDGAGAFMYDYNLLNLTAEITPFQLPMGETRMPVRFYGDYVRNLASKVENDSGYLFGVQLGRARNRGTWQASYDYRRLEADAVLAALTDGSFSQGGTDSKGHSFGLRYATSDRSTLGATYLITEGLGNNKNLDVNTLQVDFAMAF